jgi:hypothetical protein
MRRKLPKAEITRLLLGVLIVLGILYGQHAFGTLTRGSRINPAIQRDGMVDVVAVLNFEPERFHNERLAAYGMFSGRDGSVSRIRLRQVSQESLQALASLPWIDRLEPLR